MIAGTLFYWAIMPALAADGDSESYRSAGVDRFLGRYCAGCHSARTLSGGLDLEAVAKTPFAAAVRPRWDRILDRMESGEMPPKAAARPRQDEHKRVAAWIAAYTGRRMQQVTVRRLNRAEYNNTVRDLLGIDLRPADDFPQDDSAFGFDNIADSLTLSPLLLEKLMASAERTARAAVFGVRVTPGLTSRFEVPIPRRMEVTNPVLLATPAFFTIHDYDRTGLSQPGAYHATHRLPADGEYVVRITGAGNRPPASLPGEVTFWIDGRQVRSFPVEEVQMSGFERRPDYWEAKAVLTAGEHRFMVAFPNQFDGLPPRFRGPNPSTIPEPPQVDPETTFQPPGPGTPPHKVLERKLAFEKARRQFRNPAWDGLAVLEFAITGPTEATIKPQARRMPTIADLARRAWRRPPTSVELDRLSTLASAARRTSDGSTEEGTAAVVQALLASPDFLFRIDRPRPRGSAGGQFELASRLSYFLWSTMPDDELLRAAESGQVRSADALGAQVRRMLADPRSRALVENFAGQWLEVRRIESVQPDRDRFPDFDDHLRTSMIEETLRFFGHIVASDGSILDLIDGEYTFLNERLARHYGIRGVTGPEFRRVDLKGTGRGGVLTHSAVLTATSYATRTSPVLRGKWVLENLLNAPPPPPPADVPALDERGVGSEVSLRKQLELHREKAVCASCHARMDPLGFALENYDAIGAWRTVDGKIAIDPSGALPDGRPLHGADSLKKVLRQDGEAFARALAEKLFVYAMGRGVRPTDRAELERITARVVRDHFRFSSLIRGIVESAPFQMIQEESRQ